MIVYEDVNMNALPNLTDEQKKMLDELKNRIPKPDDDCPEISDSELRQMIESRRKRKERKETVAIRLSPTALETAKSFGKGYTTVLSSILEKALSDKTILKQYLQ